MTKVKDVRHPLPVTSAEWDEKVVNSPLPVVVDFWADWCGPCHMIAPYIARLAEEYSGRLLVFKLDVDANPDVAMRYGIQSIPTVLFMYRGNVKDMVIGAVPYQVLRQRVEQLLSQVPQAPQEVLEQEV